VTAATANPTNYSEGLGFHWQDNWFFKRLPDGSVHIRKYVESGSTALAAEAIIDPSSWASIVASVSALGETGTTFRMFETIQKG
jgi:hypothetical protein